MAWEEEIYCFDWNPSFPLAPQIDLPNWTWRFITSKIVQDITQDNAWRTHDLVKEGGQSWPFVCHSFELHCFIEFSLAIKSSNRDDRVCSDPVDQQEQEFGSRHWTERICLSSRTYLPKMVERLKLQMASTNEDFVFLETTDCRGGRNHRVKNCFLVLTKTVDQYLLGFLVNQENTDCCVPFPQFFSTILGSGLDASLWFWLVYLV